MSDTDDDFDMPDSTLFNRPGSKGKDKASSATQNKKKSTPSFMSGLDALVAESTLNAERSEKISEIMNLGEDILEKDLLKTEQQKARTDATEAKDKADHKAIMEDTSIRIPGVIQVFRQPEEQGPPDLGFEPPQSAGELSVLAEAVKLAESDPADLEELLRSVLVPWLRKKLIGKGKVVPPEVFRWLLRLVARHEVCAVVAAAEETLLRLLAEDGMAWRLRYQDIVHVWRACGAVWLPAASGSGDAMVDEGEEEEEEEEEEEDNVCLRTNLGPALNVVGECLRRGAHDMDLANLRELMLDLAAASLDEEVNGSCETETCRALVAVVDAMPAREYGDAFSSLVSGLCDPSVRGLESRMTTFTWPLLARNVPFKRSSSSTSSHGSSGEGVIVGGGEGEGGNSNNATDAADSVGVTVAAAAVTSAVVPSLSHEVCHRLLKERFLKDTSYVDAEESSEGLGRALKALDVLLENEDDVLESETQEGYKRQYVVVALANEMAAGSMAVSRAAKPNGEECRKMVRLLEDINRELTSVMQNSVQMSKTLLDLMKSKYTPFVPASSGVQSRLSFGGKTATSFGGENSSDDDDDDEEEEEYETESQ